MRSTIAAPLAVHSQVLAVARGARHEFSKPLRESIELLAGLGVRGDAHCGATVQHLSRLAKNPQARNLRQVHLVHAELFAELDRAGFAVGPGDLGENVTIAGLDLLALPRGARLRLGPKALVELTGLRNPCRQIDERFGAGAMAATLARSDDGTLVRKAGVMAVVVEGGRVRAGDPVVVEFPAEPHEPLAPV